MIARIYYQYFRWRYGYPCVQEVVDILHTVDISIFSTSCLECVSLYLDDMDILDIALHMHITRERVRQLLMKVYRKAKKNANKNRDKV